MRKHFAFRMRAYAMAHFEYDEVLPVTWPDATAWLQSEYTGGYDGRAYPVTLHGEIRGIGRSLDAAQERLANAIGSVLPTLALSANAAIADPLPVMAFGLDLTEPAPFVAYRSPPAEAWFPPGKRRFDFAATEALLHAVGHHPEADLLQRAVETYRRALNHWMPEERLVAGEYIYIAAETLSRAIIEQRARARAMTPKNLARLEGDAGPEALRARVLRDDVFSGDDEALDALRTASDGFEHGYLSVDEVRRLGEGVLDRSAGYVREALLGATGLESRHIRSLLADAYAEPRGLAPLIQWVTGKLARPDSSRPAGSIGTTELELEWGPLSLQVIDSAEDEVTLEIPSTLTAQSLPENVEVRFEGSGMRAVGVRGGGARVDWVRRATDSPAPLQSGDT
jgi:hypothetical protein